MAASPSLYSRLLVAGIGCDGNGDDITATANASSNCMKRSSSSHSLRSSRHSYNDDDDDYRYDLEQDSSMPSPRTVTTTTLPPPPASRKFSRGESIVVAVKTAKIIQERIVIEPKGSTTVDNLDGEDGLPRDTVKETVQKPVAPSFTASNYGAICKDTPPKPSSMEQGNKGEMEDESLLLAETTGPPNSSSLGFGSFAVVFVAGLLNFMDAVPFGVSYFPTGWSNGNEEESLLDGDSDDQRGPFPLPNKEALGMRMFFFSTAIAQAVFTLKSKFNNVTAQQMVENVPFYHALARIVVAEQGYGREALSTLFVLFGLSSILSGAIFYALGRFQLGRIIYFFPSHVLIGCIGGIGAFLVVAGIEVSTNTSFSWTFGGIQKSVIDSFHLLSVSVLFVVVLRTLVAISNDNAGKPRYPLLAPLFIFAITPLFYLGLFLCGVSLEEAKSLGYFFATKTIETCPSEECSNAASSFWSDIFDEHVWDIFRVINIWSVSWVAVLKSLPTLLGLAAFSIIHVPINIPAFSVSTRSKLDMNAELMAHGYSNALSGMFGGLQNYLCYSSSVLYARLGGQGAVASWSIVGLNALLFVVGPSVAAYTPRCMAGATLFHIGVDLVTDGLWESYHKFDAIEYSGICLITVVMAVVGMSGGLVAGVIAALSTYVVQSATSFNPIRGIKSGVSLRSSHWNRPLAASRILNDKATGRRRMLVISLQGHVFFANAVAVTDEIRNELSMRKEREDAPIVVVVDCTLVIGMDTSAAQAFATLKEDMHQDYEVKVAIFVTGNQEQVREHHQKISGDRGAEPKLPSDRADEDASPADFVARHVPDINSGTMRETVGSMSLLAASTVGRSNTPLKQLCRSLDEALFLAENVLIALQDPSLLIEEETIQQQPGRRDRPLSKLGPEEMEKRRAFRHLANLCPQGSTSEVQELFHLLVREKYEKGDIIWRQNSHSDSAKLLVSGLVKSYLEDEPDTVEEIHGDEGDMLGELGLVYGTERLSTVQCVSEGGAVFYSLQKTRWEKLQKERPHVARLVDCIVIGYLADRVQHVSNRIFETRCLPI